MTDPPEPASAPAHSAHDAPSLARWTHARLAAGRIDEVVRALTDFDATMARFLAEPHGTRALDDWYDAWHARLCVFPDPDGDERVWWDFARTNRHHLLRGDWEPWRVFFQAAMSHADDSAVTRAAERYAASGKCTWTWQRWVNRPREWQRSPLDLVLVGHRGWVRGALELRNGRLLSWSFDRTLRLWELEHGRCLAVLEGHDDTVVDAAELDDGTLVSLDRSGTRRIWTATGSAVAETAVERIAIEPTPVERTASEGTAASESSCLRMHDRPLRLDRERRPLPEELLERLALPEGHSHAVEGGLDLTDGRLVTWSADTTLRVWNRERLPVRPPTDIGSELGMQAVELDAERFLAFDSDDVTQRSFATGEVLHRYPAPLERPHGALRLEGSLVLAFGRSDPDDDEATAPMRIWDVTNGALVAVLAGHTAAVNDVMLLPDGRLLSTSADRTLRLWSADRRASVVLAGHGDGVWSARVVGPDRVASWCGPMPESDFTVRVWSLASGSCVAVLHGHEAAITGVRVLTACPTKCAPSPEDVHLISWSHDGTLRTWNLATGRPSSVLCGHEGMVFDAVEPSASRLVSVGDDRTLRMWDTTRGAEINRVDDCHATRLEMLADGRLLGFAGSWRKGDRRVEVRDGATGALLDTLATPTDWARAEPAILKRCTNERALAHALVPGHFVCLANRDHTVLSGGRQLRVYRWVEGR